MRVELEQLSVLRTRVELPPKEGDAQFVAVSAAEELRGVLEQTPGVVAIEDCAAELLALREAQLRFGTVLLTAAAELVLKRMETSFRSADDVTLSLKSEQAQCGDLRIVAGTVRASGDVRLHLCVVEQGAERGTVSTGYAEVTNFALTLGTINVRAPHLVANELSVGWGGEEGFWLSAKCARASDLELEMGTVHARVAALNCEGVAVRDGGFYVESAKADRVDARADDLAQKEPGSPGADDATKADPGARFVDYGLLDGLSGHAYVDLGVDMKIALLPRRATHRMRLELDEGRIDYRTLEHGLARLEDSLLDFSLRDNTLVLELGVPLLPTRGHGKPLVRWPLSPSDVTLAEDHEVRLSVLAQPDLPQKQRDEAADGEEHDGPLTLNELDATGIDIDLSLEPARHFEGARLRCLGFENLSVRGELKYRPEEKEGGGHLVLKGRSLSASLDAIPAGESSMSLGALGIRTLTGLNVGLKGSVPAQVTLEAGDVTVSRFALAANDA